MLRTDTVAYREMFSRTQGEEKACGATKHSQQRSTVLFGAVFGGHSQVTLVTLCFRNVFGSGRESMVSLHAQTV